ncbi:MAG TPA: hypothetical protein VGM56_32600 [Byssovorax sp.]
MAPATPPVVIEAPAAAPIALDSPPPPSAAPSSSATDEPDLPKARDRRGVTKRADGACFEFAPFHCPPGQTCKPPQPHRVRCPD